MDPITHAASGAVALLAMRPNADIPFQLMVELAPSDTSSAPHLEQLRLGFPDSGHDSLWHTPVPLTSPTFLQWLVGLR